MSIFWCISLCISITNNVKPYDKLDEYAQTANLSDYTRQCQEYSAENSSSGQVLYLKAMGLSFLNILCKAVSHGPICRQNAVVQTPTFILAQCHICKCNQTASRVTRIFFLFLASEKLWVGSPLAKGCRLRPGSMGRVTARGRCPLISPWNGLSWSVHKTEWRPRGANEQ